MCVQPVAGSDIQLTVLADRWIQRWSLNAATGAEHYLFDDFDVYRQIRDAFRQKLWSTRDAEECDVRLLDMHATRARTVLVLAAAINAAHAPQFHYALCTFVEVTGSGSGGYEMRNFCQLRHTTFAAAAAADGDEQPSDMRLLVAPAGLVYVFDERWVLQAQLNDSDSDNELCGSGELFDAIDVHAHNDSVFSGHLVQLLHQQHPKPVAVVLFLRQQGFVSVQSMLTTGGTSDAGSQQYADVSNASIGGLIRTQLTKDVGLEQPTNLSLFGLNPDDVYDNGDAVSQLKAAFIYHLKKNTSKCTEVLADLMNAKEHVDLDGIVVKIANDLVDDVPAADPRWEERIAGKGHTTGNVQVALGSSASLQIIQQLNEKKIVLQHYIEFLHSVELWPQLRATQLNNEAGVRPSALILSDISEKVVATVALKKLHHTEHAGLIDEAIRLVLRLRNESTGESSGNLTAQDLFYVQVSRVHEIVGVLAGLVAATDGSSGTNGKTPTASRLDDVITIVLAMLGAVYKFRTASSAQFVIVPGNLQQFEYVPWTALAGRSGLQDTILQLISRTVLRGTGTAGLFGSSGDADLQQWHYKQLVDLVDYYLDGRKSYLDSVQDTDKFSVLLQQYETQRSELIRPLVCDGQYELATKLAEKYLDFHTLVQICDQTENQHRLDEYIRKYQTLNFSQFAINWHLRQNKRGDLFQRFKHNQADLSRFLADHPSLAWVQAVFNDNMAMAGRVLVELAEQEVGYSSF